jgi:hypothetical protein
MAWHTYSLAPDSSKLFLTQFSASFLCCKGFNRFKFIFHNKMLKVNKMSNTNGTASHTSGHKSSSKDDKASKDVKTSKASVSKSSGRKSAKSDKK